MSPESITPIAASSSRHCSHVNARNHRCRMPANASSGLCAYHFRKSQSAQPDPQALAADLLAGINDFSTADSVNAFLGNLVRQLARKRLPRRDAVAFGYLSQLLLNSLSALDRQRRAEQDASEDFDPSKELAAYFNLIRSTPSTTLLLPPRHPAQRRLNRPFRTKQPGAGRSPHPAGV